MQDTYPTWYLIFVALVMPPVMSAFVRLRIGGWAFKRENGKLQLKTEARQNFVGWSFLAFCYAIAAASMIYVYLARLGAIHLSTKTLSNVLVGLTAMVAIAIPIASRMGRKKQAYWAALGPRLIRASRRNRRQNLSFSSSG